MKKSDVVRFENGIAVKGSFPDDDILSLIGRECGKLPLVIADPPYGGVLKNAWDKIVSDVEHAFWMVGWSNKLAAMCLPGAALYVWGGYGRPKQRAFYRYVVEVEHKTPWSMAMHITWGKKRAYGVRHNYLSTREEIAYLVNGDIRKPRKFNVPYLDQKRGYAGYNKKYPAKRDELRRTCIWTDVTEIFRGKIHEAQKPERLMEIQIETHTDVGEWVLDPFSGSGSTAMAAAGLKRKFFIVEKDDKDFEKSVARIRGEV